MRILFLNEDAYLPQFTGGVEWNTHELCQLLTAAGMDVAVLSGLNGNGFTWVLNSLRRKLHLDTQWPRDYQMGYSCFRGWESVSGIHDVISRWQPDRIIVQGGGHSSYVAAVETGIPSFYYFHTTEGAWHPTSAAKLQPRFLACSQFLGDHVAKTQGASAQVIRPIIGRDRVAVKNRKPLVIVSFGLNLAKGTDRVLQIARETPGQKFRIVETWSGNKGATEALRMETKEIPNCEIRPATADVRSYFQDCKLLLAPSRCEEAWGRVVTEAQVNSIPVLASQNGGLPESVGSGGVCLPLSDSVDAWVSKLQEMVGENYLLWTERAAEAAKRNEIQPDFNFRSFLSTISAC